MLRIHNRKVGLVGALLIIGGVLLVWMLLVWSTSNTPSTTVHNGKSTQPGTPTDTPPLTPTDPPLKGDVPAEAHVRTVVTREIPSHLVWPEGKEPIELMHNHGVEHQSTMKEIFKLGLPGIVLDVGANQAGASYTAVLHGVPVISFEALPHNVERMRRLIEKYRMGDLMTVVHGAVWSVGGMEVVFRNQEESDYNGQMDVWRTEANEEGYVAVRTVTIDSLVDEDVQFLKIDVEGCELKALLGARNLLSKHRVPFISLEYSPSNIKSTSKVDPNVLLYFLSGMGYDVYVHTCHREFGDDLRWSCELTDRNLLIQEVLKDTPTPFLGRRRVLPIEFEEFTQWMDEEVEGDGRAQVDLLFVRMADLRAWNAISPPESQTSGDNVPLRKHAGPGRLM